MEALSLMIEHDESDALERSVATDESLSVEERRRMLDVLREMRTQPIRLPRS